MMSAASPCRTYIVYHHGLFAQGVRSVLETQRGVQIVGMESDVAKALKAVQSLHPEVIIVEECARKHQPMRLGAFLNSAAAGRVVTLSLDHDFAMVYQRNRIPATDPAKIVRAIQGTRMRKQPQIPGQGPKCEKAPTWGRTSAVQSGNEDLSGGRARVRRTGRQEEKRPETIPRASRGMGRGGEGGRSASQSSLVAEPETRRIGK